MQDCCRLSAKCSNIYQTWLLRKASPFLSDEQPSAQSNYYISIAGIYFDPIAKAFPKRKHYCNREKEDWEREQGIAGPSGARFQSMKGPVPVLVPSQYYPILVSSFS